MELIEVRAVRLMGVHGVHEEEVRAPQPFEIDLDIEADTAAAAQSDDLADTVDYAAALDVVAAVMAGPRHRLLESLASEMADAVLRLGHVQAVTVALRKLDPPVPYEVGSTGVRVARRR